MVDEIPRFLKSEEEQVENQQPRHTRTRPQDDRREWGWLILAGIFILAVVVGVWAWQGSRGGNAVPSPTPSPISLFTSPPLFSPSPTPSPTPVPPDTYKVTVLNGSGRVGEAGAVKKILTGLEYSVVETGNADNYDFKSAVIRSRKSVQEAFLDKLEEVLKKEFGKVSRETVEDLPSDVVVVTGGTRLGASPTPKSTPSPTPLATATPEASKSAQ